MRNLSVNWPKLLQRFQNVLRPFYAFIFGMSFYITSRKKKSDIICLK